MFWEWLDDLMYINEQGDETFNIETLILMDDHTGIDLYQLLF